MTDIDPTQRDLPPDSATVRATCEQLRAELHDLAAYIPTTIVRRQLVAPDKGRIRGANWKGSVLFADLSGFTALSEQLSILGKQGAEDISTIINQLFGALVDDILRYGGEVLKFGGDALTAFFDTAALGEAHASLASLAALSLQARMHDFDAVTTRVGTFRLQLRIGVHSGQFFAAEVGDDEHVELVVTGRNINRVALAQEIAESGQVVVSGAAHALLSGASTRELQSGFHLLEQTLDAALPPAPSEVLWPTGAGDEAELRALEARIAALRPYLPRNLPRRFLDLAGAESGEFRPVTVLFANVFPFSNALDALGDDTDTAARVLNAYFRRAQQVIHRYGGIVNKVDMATYGDKLMALFGAPAANENDPELAVRAALDLRQALAQANEEVADLIAECRVQIRDFPNLQSAISNLQLQQRIGINTGVMFAGIVGSARRREYTVMGQHVNIAARLMSAADAGTIVVSPATRRAVERHVALRPLEPIMLKGIAEPVALAEALHPLQVAQEGRRLGRAALVGRDAELDLLLNESRAALGGSGRVVSLVGEAGVGKTRLMEEMLQRLVLLSLDRVQGVPPFFPYSIESQSYEQNTPYALLRQLLRQMLNLDFLEGSAAPQEAVQRQVEQFAPELARFTPLLNDLNVTHLPDTALTAALTPEQRRDRAQDLAEAIVLNSARQQPLIIMLDDLHWADASSLDLIARIARRADRTALLLLLAYRTEPPLAEPWAGLGHTRGIMLRELSAEHSAALVGNLLGAAPPEEFNALLERTQGNPFFIEEVMRELVEGGTVALGPNGWQLARPLDEISVPDSIEGVIIARLDRLEERSREVLQVASVVGRRFPYHVLLGVLLKHDDLQERLGSLTEANLILLEEIERELAYLFKHALTRDVAYEAILYARRRELHRMVARQIERLYPHRLDDQLAVLARHYLLAEAWPQAFHYHLRAGRQAQGRYANREAITFFDRALQIADRLQGTEDRGQGSDHNQIGASVPYHLFPVPLAEIHERLGTIHALIGEYDQALKYFEVAGSTLDHAQRGSEARVRLHHHIARVYEKRAEFETAFQRVEQALALDPGVSSAETVRCLLLGAGIHRRQGRYAQALEWGERALTRAETLDSMRDQALALKLLGGTHLGMGNNLRAYDLLSRCLALYSEVNDLSGRADAHNDLANTCYELGRLDEARANYEAGLAIKEEIGDVYGQAMIANNLGGVLKLQGDIAGAIDQYQHSLAMFDRLGSLYAGGVLHMNLGAMYLRTGELAIAEGYLQRSAELFQQAGAEDFLPELERYLTELQLVRGDLPRARFACELALDTAARLEARGEEGITRRVLARILTLDNDTEAAWRELHTSLDMLREANNRYETARTLLAIAALAPSARQAEQGQHALEEAAVILHALGARSDLGEAHDIAVQNGYDTARLASLA